MSLLGWWRRLMADDGRLRLAELLRQRGLPAFPEDGNAAVTAAATAVRRCVFCTEHARCDRFLEAREWTALREICPNTQYIDALERKTRR